jgi:hypothetical protein
MGRRRTRIARRSPKSCGRCARSPARHEDRAEHGRVDDHGAYGRPGSVRLRIEGRGRASLTSLEHALRIFRAGGFGPREAALCNHALGNYVAGAALWEAVGLAGTTGEERTDEARRAAAALAQLSTSDYPAIAEAAPDLFAGSADDRFEFGLDCLLEGFAARLTTPSAGDS